MPTMREIMDQLVADIEAERTKVGKLEEQVRVLKEQRIPAAKARIHKAERLLRQLHDVYEEPAPKVEVRDETGRHVCSVCGAKFDSYQDLAAHEKATHPELAAAPRSATTCPECGLVAASLTGLGVHRARKHGIHRARAEPRGPLPGA